MVLLVEDDPTLRQTLHEVMADEGFEVVVAVDGQDALDWLTSTKSIPNAIVTDLMMPRLDGWELCEILHKRTAWSGIPILVLSTALYARAWPQGAEPLHQMRKPPDLDRFISTLSQLAMPLPASPSSA